MGLTGNGKTLTIEHLDVQGSLNVGQTPVTASSVTVGAEGVLRLENLDTFQGPVSGEGTLVLDLHGDASFGTVAADVAGSAGDLSGIIDSSRTLGNLRIQDGTALWIGTSKDDSMANLAAVKHITVEAGGTLACRLKSSTLMEGIRLTLAGAGSDVLVGGTTMTGALVFGPLDAANDLYVQADIDLSADATIMACRDTTCHMSGDIDTQGYTLTKTGGGSLQLTGNITGGGELHVAGGSLNLGPYSSDGQTMDLSTITISAGSLRIFSDTDITGIEVRLNGGTLDAAYTSGISLGHVVVGEAGGEITLPDRSRSIAHLEGPGDLVLYSSYQRGIIEVTGDSSVGSLTSQLSGTRSTVTLSLGGAFHTDRDLSVTTVQLGEAASLDVGGALSATNLSLGSVAPTPIHAGSLGRPANFQLSADLLGSLEGLFEGGTVTLATLDSLTGNELVTLNGAYLYQTGDACYRISLDASGSVILEGQQSGKMAYILTKDNTLSNGSALGSILLGTGDHLILTQGAGVGNIAFSADNEGVDLTVSGGESWWNVPQVEGAGIRSVEVETGASLRVARPEDSTAEFGAFNNLEGAELDISLAEGAELISEAPLFGWGNLAGERRLNLAAGSRWRIEGGAEFLNGTELCLAGGLVEVGASSTLSWEGAASRIATAAGASAASEIGGEGTLIMGSLTSAAEGGELEFHVQRSQAGEEGNGSRRGDLRLSIALADAPGAMALAEGDDAAPSEAATLLKTGEGNLELTNANKGYSGTVRVAEGELLLTGAGQAGTGSVIIEEDATLTLAHDEATAVLNDLEMQAGSTLRVGAADTLAGDSQLLGTIVFQQAVANTGAITLGSTTILDLSALEAEEDGSYTLFTGSGTVAGYETLTLGQITGVALEEGQGLLFTQREDALSLSFTAVPSVPEPATTTLSLLALAALAARRRRK